MLFYIQVFCPGYTHIGYLMSFIIICYNYPILSYIKVQEMKYENLKIHRAEILHFLDDPVKVGDADSYEYFPDGLLILKNGRGETVGPAR